MVKVIYLMLMLSLFSCGKKTPDGSADFAPVQNFQPIDIIDQTELYKSLTTAIQKNDPALVKEIVEANPDLNLNQINEDGETYLMFTIRKGFKEIRNFLIDSKIDLNKKNTLGESALLIAAKTGKADSVYRLLDEKRLNDKRINLDIADEQGTTPLIAAIKGKHNQIAIELLKMGANYKLKDNDHNDAQEYAHRLNLEDVIEMIDLLIQSAAGMPDANTFAGLLKTAGVKTISAIITKYPDVVRLHQEINPLVIVLENQSMNTVPVLVTLLIQNKADVNGPVNAAVTPIVKAIQMKNLDYLRMLLARKANYEILDQEGKSTLVHAVEQNAPEMVTLLRSYNLSKNYSTVRNGIKYKYNSCDVARSVQKSLDNKEDQDKNEDIKDILKCGLRWLPFI